MPDLPSLIDAYAAGHLRPYRLAWALGETDPRAAYVRGGKAYLIDSMDHLVVREVVSVDDPTPTEDRP